MLKFITDDEVADSEIEPSKEMIDYIMALDAEHGLGLPFDEGIHFLKNLLLQPGLADVFFSLSSNNQCSVIDNFLYAHEHIFDLRGVILFLNICPNIELFTDLGHDIIDNDANIAEIRQAFSLENRPYDSIPDDLAIKMFKYSRMWLVPDVHAVWIAFSLSNVYGYSALSDILDRAIELKIELSSTRFVKLMQDWENLQNCPLTWALEMISMTLP